MGATNRTFFARLSQFVRTDKPTWLSDYNSDMSKIDGALVNLDNADKEQAAQISDILTRLHALDGK